MIALTQAAPEVESPKSDGLRSRKKEKTRLAIENAALDLFAEKGYEETTVDAIAERAEISKATFFRYFATKADVIFSVESYHLEALQEAIVKRPKREADLMAVRHAVLEMWVPLLDPERVARQGRAASSSSVLRGMSLDLGVKWQGAIAVALARRRGVDEPDQRCWLAAGAALSVFSNAINCWLYRGCPGDLQTAVDNTFTMMIDVWAECGKTRPQFRKSA